LASPSSSFNESVWQSTCATCALNDKENGLIAENTARDPQSILRSFKTRFTRDSGGQSYDQLKKIEASEEVKIYILGGLVQQKQSRVTAAAGAAISSIAPGLRKIGSNIASRMKRTDAQIEDEERERLLEESQKALQRAMDLTPEEELLRSAAFEDLLFQRGRTVDDVFALQEGSLLQLYRCGVQSFDTLKELGFNPVMHLRGKQTSDKVPVWQLHDLYGFKFEHLVEDEAAGGFAMTVRDICEMVTMLAPEWALIGATASKLIALQMDLRSAALLGLPLQQWEKYLALEPAHFHAIGIRTRHHFVNVMKWDETSPLCPRQ